MIAPSSPLTLKKAEEKEGDRIYMLAVLGSLPNKLNYLSITVAPRPAFISNHDRSPEQQHSAGAAWGASANSSYIPC